MIVDISRLKRLKIDHDHGIQRAHWAHGDWRGPHAGALGARGLARAPRGRARRTGTGAGGRAARGCR